MTLRVPPWLIIAAALAIAAAWSSWTGAEAVLAPILFVTLFAAVLGLASVVRVAAYAAFCGRPGRWSWSQRWRDPLVLLGVTLALAVLCAEVYVQSEETSRERREDVAAAVRSFAEAEGRLPADLAELERHAGRTLPGPSHGASFRWNDDEGTVRVEVVPRHGFPWTFGR